MKCPKHTTGGGPCYCDFIKASRRLAQVCQLVADELNEHSDVVHAADAIQEQIDIINKVDEHV